MPKLIFKKPSEETKADVVIFKHQFVKNNEAVIHGGVYLEQFQDYESWLAYTRAVENGNEEGVVPFQQVWLAYEPYGNIAGILDIRPVLPKEKEEYGHMGYSVAPNYRRKGAGAAMAKWATEKLLQSGLQTVQVCCMESNIASQKTLETCGYTKTGSYFYEKENENVFVYKYISKQQPI